MPIAKTTTAMLSIANPNVSVSTTTNADSVILEVWNQKRRYPPIALLPNTQKDLEILPDSYRLDFNFLRFAGPAQLQATVVTPSRQVTKSGTAQPGRTGTVPIFAKV
jgi:hypothetical protein